MYYQEKNSPQSKPPDRPLQIKSRTQIQNSKHQVKLQSLKEDPDDDIILNTAYSGKANYIVTGDNHLLALKEFKRIQIIDINRMLNISK